MSSGIVHRKASLILSVGFLLGGILSFDINYIQYIFGALLGVIITPDWDVDSGFIMDKTIRKNLGKRIEILWDGFLYWYRRSLKHGSPLSHFPVISTFGRIIYIFFWIIILPHIAIKVIFSPNWDLTNVLSIYWYNILFFWRILLGLCASDLIHWVLDISTTEHLPKKKKTIPNKKEESKI